jgi:hypothetical protein
MGRRFWQVAVYGTYFGAYAILCVWLDRALGGSEWWFFGAIPLIVAAWFATVHYGDNLRAAAHRHPKLFAVILP